MPQMQRVCDEPCHPHAAFRAVMLTALCQYVGSIQITRAARMHCSQSRRAAKDDVFAQKINTGGV
jgi:hypothetical protein